MDTSRGGLSRRAWLRAAGFAAAVGVPGGFATRLRAGRFKGVGVDTVDDLDTPAMIVDLKILERNIREMAELCEKVAIPLQVHIKTHKIPEIAHMQLRAGAVGICCQKLGEAEIMVAAGIRENILVPYNIVGPQKLIRLSRLCKRATMTVAVDSEITAQGISDRLSRDGTGVRVLIELDTGGRRTGVQSPKESLELARKVDRMPSLELGGVMTYPSRSQAKAFMEETIDLFTRAGLPIQEISGGGTGLEEVSKEIGCNVTRSGSYVFEGLRRINDATNPPNPTTCATRMVVTVVSTPTPDRIIVDGGRKTFDRRPAEPHGYGYIVEHPDVKFYAMSVEHGHLDVSGSGHRFRVGERLSIVPRHQGITINQHDRVYAVRNGIVEAVWPVAARGRVS